MELEKKDKYLWAICQRYNQSENHWVFGIAKLLYFGLTAKPMKFELLEVEYWSFKSFLFW